jgi:hypothetical protein
MDQIRRTPRPHTFIEGDFSIQDGRVCWPVIFVSYTAPYRIVSVPLNRKSLIPHGRYEMDGLMALVHTLSLVGEIKTDDYGRVSRLVKRANFELHRFNLVKKK